MLEHMVEHAGSVGVEPGYCGLCAVHELIVLLNSDLMVLLVC